MTIEILERREAISELAFTLAAATCQRFQGIDRRRSERVEPGRELSVNVGSVGPSQIVSLSLGGATIDSPGRIEPGVTHRLSLEYGELRAETEIVTHSTRIEELFYGGNGRSWVRFRSRVLFLKPSVSTLNLVYRVLADHWVAPPDDDTRPLP